MQSFQDQFGFPQVAGAIDGTHIPIKAPEDAPEDYFNRKHFYSIALQGVVDADGKFIDTNVGLLAVYMMLRFSLFHLSDINWQQIPYSTLSQLNGLTAKTYPS